MAQCIVQQTQDALGTAVRHTYPLHSLSPPLLTATTCILHMQDWRDVQYGFDKYGYDAYGYDKDGYDKYGECSCC